MPDSPLYEAVDGDNQCWIMCSPGSTSLPPAEVVGKVYRENKIIQKSGGK